MKVACIGEAMVELSLDSAKPDVARVGFAGDTLNTAIYLKRMAGAAIEVSYVSRLGQDVFSDRMVGFIADEGIGTEAIDRDPGRLPGLYAITTDATGERAFSYWRDASAARYLFQTGGGSDFSALLGFDVLYFSAITLAILPAKTRAALFDWLPIFKAQADKRVVFDSNYRAGLWDDAGAAKDAIEAAWHLTDIGLPSVGDEMAVFGDTSEAGVLARLRSYGVNSGALKRGKAGPLPLSEPDFDKRFPPAPTVVDTTAAGDSFNGAYLAALLGGQGEIAALRAGHACAAIVVGHRGAIVPKGSMPEPLFGSEAGP